MAFSAPKKRSIVSTRGRAGTPKQEGLALAFPGTRTLTLGKVVNFSAPNSLSKLAPQTRCPFIQMVSASPRGRPRNHAQYSSSCLEVFNWNVSETVPCPLFKDARCLQTSGQRCGKGRPQTRENSPLLFPITWGRGSVLKWRHFLQRPLLQNDPFYKPG